MSEICVRNMFLPEIPSYVHQKFQSHLIAFCFVRSFNSIHSFCLFRFFVFDVCLKQKNMFNDDEDDEEEKKNDDDDEINEKKRRKKHRKTNGIIKIINKIIFALNFCF